MEFIHFRLGQGLTIWIVVIGPWCLLNGLFHIITGIFTLTSTLSCHRGRSAYHRFRQGGASQNNPTLPTIRFTDPVRSIWWPASFEMTFFMASFSSASCCNFFRVASVYNSKHLELLLRRCRSKFYLCSSRVCSCPLF